MNLGSQPFNEPSEVEIRTILSKRSPNLYVWDDGYAYRRAAVLIPLVCEQQQWKLLYTRRTERVVSHKGQVAFPGGATDEGDASPEETALREAYEEIGLAREKADVLGILDEYPTISNYLITPVVAKIDWPFAMVLSPEEVERVFFIPLRWLAERSHWEEHPRVLPTGRHENVIYFTEYDHELLWGITARITVHFLETLGVIF